MPSREIDWQHTPDEWSYDVLDNLLVLMRNGFTGEQSSSEIGHPVTRIETISEGTINYKKVRYIDGLSDEQIEKWRLEVGDILLSHINSEPHLGKTAIYKGDPELLIHGMNLLLMRGDSSKLLPTYLNYAFNYLRECGFFIRICSRSVNQSSINQGKMGNVPIAYPALNEQCAIVSMLAKIQEAISAQQEIIDRTRELKKALMSKLFTEGLRGELTKETEIGPVPKSWNVSSIGEKARLSSGGTPSRGQKEYWEDGLIPWVKTGEIDYKLITQAEEHITQDGLKNSSAKLFPKGTLLVAMYGQGITRGKVGILGLEATTNQACAAIFPKPDIDTEYLYYYLTYSYERLRALSHGAQQKNLSAQIVSSFKFGYPELEDQKQIVMSLKIIDEKLKIEETALDSFQDLFKTMLNELMTGSIRTTPLMEA